MEKAAVKGIPYGVARFDEVRNENFYYVDKTMYLPLLEGASKYLFLIRPRRFGKSVFVSMMQAYYDIDFSLAGAGMERLEYTFNDYCCAELDSFIKQYKDFYDESTFEKVLAERDAASKLRLINSEARRKKYLLYLIIDEYDNFTNVILSEGGKEVFRNLTHASGFYREYFKIFKAMFTRIFMIGVSPVTLDDLTSGYNLHARLLRVGRAHHVPILQGLWQAACRC